MFGRSGQMFPRQRAFHDAIYEEEYGSDQEDECCQSRGMSAIFCWFLSVIILIGLAASVVLTVFFILKSKNYMSKNGDLDLLYDGDHGINFHFPETTTQINNIDFPSSSSSKESRYSSEDIAKSKSTIRTTSTRFPPSRKGPHQIFSEDTTTVELPPKSPKQEERNDFSGSSGEGFNTGNPKPWSDENISSDKSSRYQPDSIPINRDTIIITTTQPPSQHVLFTSPPDPTTSTSHRRNLQTTRFPTGRTSFSTSTETLVEHEDETEDENDGDKNDDHNENDNEEEQEESNQDQDSDNDDNDVEATNNSKQQVHKELDNNDTGELTTTTAILESESKSKETENNNEENDESQQLNKMLLDEIPPHQETRNEDNENPAERVPSLSSEFNLGSKEKSKDPLARIIKNLAPKWGRNRTIETTTMTSGNHKYDFTISSREKTTFINVKDSDETSSSQERSTTLVTPETLLKTSESSRVLNTIKSPNLSRKKPESESESESGFLDVLVGSEDHKTLITKQTEDGIVTSAILPPWYDTPNSNNSSTVNSTESLATSSSNEQQGINGNRNDNVEQDKPDEEQSASSVFGGLLDFFKTLPINAAKDENYNPKRIVLKRPGGELLAQGSSTQHSVHNSGESNEVGNIDEILPSNIRTTTISSVADSAVVTDDILQANNAFHYGTPDGGTNIYGYYPDDEQANDKTVEHQGVQSESLSEEFLQKVQNSPSPSHSIELHINSDGSQEVVIEQEVDDPVEEYSYSRYGETPAGSENHRQVVSPPPSLRGGGIRRPLTVVKKESLNKKQEDMEMKGSENRPVYASRPQSISPQLIRQRPINITKKISKVEGPISSVEIGDNSAEHEGKAEFNSGSIDNTEPSSFAPDEEGGENHNNQVFNNNNENTFFTSGSGEGETSGSGEQVPAKWSKPDKSIPSTSLELDGELNTQPETTGSDERKMTINSADDNEVLERKPVVELDDKLYPDSVDTSSGISSTESKVHQVYPVGYTSTTERPATNEPTISEPGKSNEEENSNNNGFVAPTPVSFHDNKYTFSAPSSDSIYQSKDGWRPLLYNGDSSEPTAPGVREPTITKAPHWRDRLQGMIRNPTQGTTATTFQKPTTTPIAHPNSNENVEYEEYDEEEDRLIGVSGEIHLEGNEWGQREQLSQQQQGNSNKAEPIAQSSNIIPNPVKFPENYHSKEVVQSQQNYPQQNDNVRQQNRPQQLPIPMHIHHNNNNNNQPQMHHIQRQQFQFPNNQLNIDRSKYMMRPAPPPIVMRRAPNKNVQYLTNRTGPLRPQLIPQVQQQNQFNNNAPQQPTEFPPQPPLLNRRFKNLGPRPRGNINWPTEESRKIDTADRRNG